VPGAIVLLDSPKVRVISCPVVCGGLTRNHSSPLVAFEFARIEPLGSREIRKYQHSPANSANPARARIQGVPTALPSPATRAFPPESDAA